MPAAAAAADPRRAARPDEARHYRLIFRTVADAMMVVEEDHVLDVNPAFERLFALPRDAAVGRKWLSLFPASQRLKMAGANWEAGALSLEIQARSTQGQHLELSCSAQRVYDRGRVLQIICLRDLGASKRQEREREEALAMLVHDLRSPMSAIVGYHYLIADDPSLTREECVEFARSAQESAVYQLSLINDILEGASLAGGQREPAATRVDLDEVLAQVLAEARPQALRRQVALEPCLTAGLALLAGDAGQLRRVLTNLLTNAIRYARGQVGLRGTVANGVVELRVEDDGPGIAADQRLALFAAWNRGGARQEPGSGYGLGLAIARQLVEAHGGRISIQDSPLGGAAFVVSLPQDPAAA